ncbi:low temperature requirement protein A [Bacteroides nordii]|uniref:low temperature requirement protein A n=1 Tax=Bacteroides nordii TaxID=291645 RepID=UPI002A7F4FCF|nr:low temperature requirement protein A [Bacteroides nordii]
MSHSLHSLLRKRDTEIASVSYSELLFDLIYVFSVTQLSHYLLHHLDWMGLLQETILWFAVWMLWQHTIWVTNWFNPDARPIRILLFAIMLIGLVMAASIPYAFTYRSILFAVCYVLIQVGRTLYVNLILGRNHHLSANFRRIMGWFCISAVFWIAGAFLQGTWQIIFWIIAVLCDYTSPMFGFALPFLGRSDSRTEWTIEGHHLVERCQLFVIIAFGETLLMTGASLSDVEEWNPLVVTSAIISFIGSLAMWWVYFDVSSEAGSQKIVRAKDPGWLGLIYNTIHVILVGAIIICAVGDELIVAHPDKQMSYSSIFVLIIGPIIYIMANSIYKLVTCRLIPLSHIISVAVLVLLIPWPYHVSLLTINILVTSVFVFIIVFDSFYPDKGYKISVR